MKVIVLEKGYVFISARGFYSADAVLNIVIQVTVGSRIRGYNTKREDLSLAPSVWPALLLGRELPNERDQRFPRPYLEVRLRFLGEPAHLPRRHSLHGSESDRR